MSSTSEQRDIYEEFKSLAESMRAEGNIAAARAYERAANALAGAKKATAHVREERDKWKERAKHADALLSDTYEALEEIEEVARSAYDADDALDDIESKAFDAMHHIDEESKEVSS